MVLSDGAGNYRDPTTEVDWKCVGTRCFSEAGMGKDQVDANSAPHKGGLKRKRDLGFDMECARDYYEGARSLNIRAQNYGILTLDRDMEKTSFEGRKPVPNISTFGVWGVTEETIAFWESLDEAASRVSIPENGRAVGFGPGYVLTHAQFDASLGGGCFCT